MHLWNTRQLAVELLNKTVSQRDSARYMMVASGLYVQANYSALWFGGYRDWTLLFEALVVVAISLVGVHECYKANGAEDGTEFLMRYGALGIPIGLKVAILAVVCSQAMYYGFPHIANQGTFRDPVLVYRVAGFFLSLALVFVYYWRIAHHLGLIRATEASRQNAL
jgi:hypothetical protein